MTAGDVRFSTPCSSMFMLPILSSVLSKSNPWNIERWKCSRMPSSRGIATMKPAVPGRVAGILVWSPG
jgi:hypothetical protein